MYGICVKVRKVLEVAMNTTKLKEALVELQQQRAILDVAIKNIQQVLATLNGSEATAQQPTRTGVKPSYIDLSVQVLEQTGHPLHVKDICEKMTELRGSPVSSRASVESSIIRHMNTTGDRARIAKVRPSTYGLPGWETVQTEAIAPPTSNSS
jgi:uncharacterized protein (DUF362 family)